MATASTSLPGPETVMAPAGDSRCPPEAHGSPPMITEARSPAHDFFGTERLDRTLCELPHPVTAEAAVARVAKAVADFEAGGVRADDQTLVAVSVRPR